MIRHLIMLAALPIAAKAQVPSATDVTVRLASTQVVHSLTIIPISASMRSCDSCAAELVPSRLMLESKGSDISANGLTMSKLLLKGSMRLDVGNQHFNAAGRWKIASAKDGLHITITLPSERYVKAVLMAESPNEPMEALKAEAVAIRTFALMNLHRHSLEGLCDSTHCEVMRLDKVPESISRAVDDTAGETLWFAQKRAETYFTESCGGISGTWPAGKPWLVVHPDPYCERAGSHWRASIAEADLRRALNAEGWKWDGPIREIRVASRNSSGRAAKLLVDAKTMDAPSFRFAVDRQLGWNQIRSDLYVVSTQGDKFIFEGKGFGHGVGLCQLGAREMAREGMNYRQILDFYFPKTQVRIEPEDHGWHEFMLGGVKMRSTVAVNATLPTGIGAGKFIVTVYPTTELFRQATNQPGWMLGSTSGSQVSLQPIAVLERYGGITQMLKHELMHAVIEQETSPDTPLWLREGLVEVLTGELGSDSMSIAAMEQGLRQPRSLAESQAAHKAAAAKVHMLVQQNGLEVVRGWVRSGRVPPMQ